VFFLFYARALASLIPHPHLPATPAKAQAVQPVLEQGDEGIVLKLLSFNLLKCESSKARKSLRLCDLCSIFGDSR